MSALPDVLADRAGIFLKHDIQLETRSVTNIVTSVQALAAGNTDVAFIDVPNSISAREAGFNVRFLVGHVGHFAGSIICQKSLNFTADTASGSKVDTTYPAIMKQLIGKRVGVPVVGGAPDTYLRITLLDSGIDPSKVNIISTGTGATATVALASGNLDCALLSEPGISELADSTSSILDYAIGQGPKIFRDNYAFAMIATTPKFAAAHRTVVRNVAEAFVESERRICDSAKSKVSAAKIAALVTPDYPGLDIHTLTQVIQHVAPASCNAWHIGRNVIAGGLQVWNRLHPADTARWPYEDFIAPQVLDLTGPSVTFSKTTRKGSTVTLAWRGADRVGPYDVSDISSGVKSYTVQTSIDGGHWVTRAAGRKATTYTLRASPTSKIKVRIRGRDQAGNNGPWAQASI
jgi:ABC-type nitrate/sulfonate/bicarbonate transport system substrate-binding protein